MLFTRFFLFCFGLFIGHSLLVSAQVNSVDDVIFIGDAATLSIDVLANDFIPNDFTPHVNILSQPSIGHASVDPNTQIITYQRSPLNDESSYFDILTYSVECSEANQFGQASIFILSGTDSNVELEYYEGFEPNDISISAPDLNAENINVCDLIGCVWPGDTDNDGFVDVWDALNVGVAYGMEGPARIDADASWTQQYAPDWAFDNLNGINYKHIDCDGNGIIDAADMNIVSENYQEVSGKADDITEVNSDVELKVEILNETVSEGETVQAVVKLGENFDTYEDIYGVAFRLSYDSEIINPNSFEIEYVDSWIGTTEDILFFKHVNPGTVDISIVRMDHNNMMGGGLILPLSFVMEEVLLGKIRDDEVINIEVLRSTIIDNTGVLSEISASGDAKEIVTTGTDELHTSLDFGIYPNPANQFIQLNLPSYDKAQVRITDSNGQVWEQYLMNNQKQLNIHTSHLPSGMYFLSVQNKHGIVNQRINIVH